MKSTGIIRKMDTLGRVVIPKEIRKAFSINIGDLLEICTDGKTIVIRKFVTECTVCGYESIHLYPFKKSMLCKKCLSKLNR